MYLELVITGVMPFKAIDSSCGESFRTALGDAEFVKKRLDFRVFAAWVKLISDGA
jgi:hypothetical protein